MFQHLPELVIVLIIGLIFFGPEKLPEVAGTAGKMMREVREAMETALNPQDTEVPEDFSTYYYESLDRAGEEVPEAEGEDGTVAADGEFAGWHGAEETASPDPVETPPLYRGAEPDEPAHP